MMPGEYILTAVPVNVINALIVVAMLNPVTVSADEDTIATMKSSAMAEKEIGDVDENGNAKKNHSSPSWVIPS